MVIGSWRAKRKTFRPWQQKQITLLPPSPREWLSDDHQVYFLLDLVDELDLSEILIPALAKDPRGEKEFDLRMLTMPPLYAYCVGIVSFRKIGRACYEVLAFPVLTGNQQPATAGSESSAVATSMPSRACLCRS